MASSQIRDKCFNDPAESGARPFYDLTNPIVWFKDEAEIAVVADQKPDLSTLPLSTGSRGLIDFDHYASKLLEAVYTSPEISRGAFPANGQLLSPTLSEWTQSPPIAQTWGPSHHHEMQGRSSMSKPSVLELEEETNGCINAIESVSRSSPKGKSVVVTVLG